MEEFYQRGDISPESGEVSQGGPCLVDKGRARHSKCRGGFMREHGSSVDSKLAVTGSMPREERHKRRGWCAEPSAKL